MCLPRIDRIAFIAGEEATLDGGTERISLLCVPDARVGDHVMIHAGYAIGILEPDEAAKRSALMAEVAGEGFRL